MKRALVILLGAVLVALFLVGMTLAFLAATDRGTRLLADQAERLLPLELDDVSGALLGEVRVGALRYRLEDRTLTIEDLALQVQAWPLLFENLLIVDSATAASVALDAGTAPGDGGPTPPLELPFMPLGIDLRHLHVGRLAIEPVFPMAVTAAAAWRGNGVEVRTLEIDSAVIDLSVTGRLGSGPDPRLAADVEWSVPDSSWSGSGRVDGRVSRFDLRHTLRGPVAGTAAGTGSLSNLAEPAVDVGVELDDLVFGEVAVRGVDGRLQGTLANLRADATAQVAVPRLAPFEASVSAYGPVTGPLTLGSIVARAAGGTQQAQGSVAWADGVQVSLGGYLREIDLAALREELSGRADASFQFLYRDERVSLELADLAGTLAGRPIGGALALDQVDSGWRLDPVRLTVGANSLNGRAEIAGGRVSVEADVDGPELGALALGVTGDLTGRVVLDGAWPALDGRVSLSSAELGGFGASVSGGRLQASLVGGRIDGTLSADRAGSEALQIDAPALAVSGPVEHFDWQFRWASGDAAGGLDLRTADRALRVDRLRFAALDRDWALQAPVVLRQSPDRLAVEDVCIGAVDAALEASACVAALTLSGERLETRGELVRAPVALLTPWLPVQLADTGYLEGRWDLAGRLAELRGEVALSARELAFVPATEEEAVALPDLEASGRVEDGGLDVRLAASDPAFNVVGDLALAPLARDGALTGAIEVAIDDLAPARVFDQRIETLEGRVDGSLSIAGTPAEPRVTGRFELADGSVRLNDPDTRLQDFAARLEIDDSGRFQLTGSGRQKNGDVRLDASGSGLFDGALQAEATLRGEGLQARHPDWELTVSPDLTLRVADGRARLRGRVDVPAAEVRLNTLPQSVPSPSDDVVVVGRESANGNGGNALRVDVEVVLGDDVSLKAYGFSAELEGSLRARLDAQGRTSLRGTLDVTGGVLSAQGQLLTIESGTVVYNGPVGRPYIDLRAVRVIDDVTPSVTVGLHIRGDADNLTSSVFSEPPMSETRALGFLVLGRDITRDSEDTDGSQLMAAAINLGLSRSKGLTSELMRMTGLDELSASAESQDSFAIVAGKRISDDLYVRYTYNTLSAVGVFLVRYELTKRWLLEAESGEQSSMDLLYSFEK